MAKKDIKIGETEKNSFFSEIVRKFKESPLLYIGSVIILILISVTFLAGDLMFRGSGGGTDFIFGYYDRVPITLTPGNTFSRFIEQIERNYRSHGIDTSDFQVSFAIWRQAFETMALHTAILQEVNRSNYSISSHVVDEFVAQLPDFQEVRRDGTTHFSAALYRQMPESRRMALWQQVREELIKGMYYDDLQRLLIPSSEAQFIADMTRTMRNFELVSFRVEDFPASEYLAFAENNRDKFRAIHLSRISAGSSEREAQRIRDSILEGVTTFEEAARSQSQDGFSDRGGDMGLRYIFELEWDIPNTEVRENVLRLNRGEMSGITQIGTNWVFFRVEEELKDADFEDEAVMEKVRTYVRDFERGRMEDFSISRAEDFIQEAAANGFLNTAMERGMDVHNFGPLPINYGGVDLFNSLESFTIPILSSSDLSGMSVNENFWRVAYSAPINSPSRPLVQGSNVFVFYPAQEIEIEEDRMESIASMYSSYWLRYITEQWLHTFFLLSDKMDNRFFETYTRIFFN